MGYEKGNILIVDDSEMNRALLTELLEDRFSIVEAENGIEAATILHEREQDISLILLDIVMPEMDGFAFLELMNQRGWIKSIPVIMISAETIPTGIDRAYDLGVVDYISRPFDERTVQHRVDTSIALSARQRELSHMAVNQVFMRENDHRLMIEILANLVEFRNGESGLHVLHIRTITEWLLKSLLRKTDRCGIRLQDIPTICSASSLHDIGKIAVPSEILNKPGRLTGEEIQVMRTHTTEGAKILENIPMREKEALIQYGYQICRWHHERCDGRGYPDGLKGDEIPIAAQVVGLADVYDALTSQRVYKAAFSHEKALEMIRNGECGQFSPLLLDCLQDISDELKAKLDTALLEQHSEKGVLSSVQEIVKQDELDGTERTLELLEREREKYQFCIEHSNDLYFEYVDAPEMVMLSQRGAACLGMPEIILNPREHEFGCGLFKKQDFEEFLELLRHTVPENPTVEKEYTLRIKDGQRPCRITARSLWSGGTAPEREGAVGRILEL